MVIPSLIEHKRDGRAAERPSSGPALIRAYAAGTVPDYQMSALLMAVFFRGLEPAELAALTDAMIDSGDRLRVRRPPGPGGRQALDRRRGRQGLAPARADGGELRRRGADDVGPRAGPHRRDARQAGVDSRDSGPTSRCARRATQIDRLGCAMLGQTPEIAPADKRLYALRDVTGTVESIPLISASIMSKKLAEGLNGLVLDVKTGSGAFLHRAGAGHRAGPHHDRSGRGAGLPDRRAAHRDGPAARPRLRQRARGGGGDRGPAGRRAGRPDGGDLRARRGDAGAGGRRAGSWRTRGARLEEAVASGRALETFARHHRGPGRQPRGDRGSRPAAAGAGGGGLPRRPRRGGRGGRAAADRPGDRGARAAGARRWRTRWIRRSASSSP